VERGNEPITPAAAASLLQWWTDAGVDMLVDEAPRDWLRAKAPPAIPLAPNPARQALAAPAPSDALPDQLELFRGYLRDAAALPFASPAAKRVCPAGDPAAGLMIMTDMPAAEDCGTGTLLSGEEGRLFDRMLAAIGRDRGSIYLASLSCLRSPDGRFTTGAAQECARLALHHIGLAAPKALLLFGDAPAKALLGLPMVQARGRWHEVATHAGPVRAIVSFPPSYLLTQPSAKAAAWADLQMLIEGLKT
jgi:DNA polymerase